jgi:selenium metabolism protein YedF
MEGDHMGSLLDCRGLACPAPVLQTKKLIDKERPHLIEVRVDNDAARENVTRFLESQRFEVRVEKTDSEFLITGSRAGEQPPSPVCDEPDSASRQKIMVMIATDRVGRGDDELGLKLMSNFLKTLKEMGPELWRIVLVNNGVKLSVEGSEVLPSLKDLEGQGVSILVCGTCLNHFGLLEQKRSGETTNMLDIVTSMQVADKVISI